MKVFLTVQEVKVIDNISFYLPGILVFAVDRLHAEYILKNYFRLMDHKIIDSENIEQITDRAVQWDSLIIPHYFQMN